MVGNILVIIGLAVALALCLTYLLRRQDCDHLVSRCIHGDEIMAVRGKGYHRQRCMECNKPLKRPPICGYAGLHRHQWQGAWPEDWTWKEDFIYKR